MEGRGRETHSNETAGEFRVIKAGFDRSESTKERASGGDWIGGERIASVKMRRLVARIMGLVLGKQSKGEDGTGDGEGGARGQERSSSWGTRKLADAERERGKGMEGVREKD